MAMELVKEPLKINHVVREEVLQFSVQGDVIIPDVKPDIVKILCVNSDVVVSNREIYQDRIIAEGTINFKIIYLCDDEERPVRALNASLSFKEPIEAVGTRTDMRVALECYILNTEYDILNERKVSVKGIAQINASVNNVVEVELITDIRGMEDIQKLKNNINICKYIGEASEKCMAKEEIEISDGKPPIFELLGTHARVSKDIKITDNKTIVNGEIHATTLYAADDEDRSIQTMEYDIPFTQCIEIAGIHENALCDLDVNIKDVFVRILDAEDGDPRILDNEFTIEINARGFEWEEKEIILDSYSPNSRIEMESQQIEVNQMVREEKSEIVIKEILELSDKQTINEVYNVICKPCMPEIKIQEERISFEGVVDVWVLGCTGEDNMVMCSKHEIPYSNTMEIKGVKGDISCGVKLDVEQCNNSILSGQEIEVKVVISAVVKVYGNIKIDIISDVKHTESYKNEFDLQPTLTLYYIQPGDTLWKIGKRFNTTIEELKNLNDIADSNLLSSGRQILIQKKVVEKELIKKII